MQITCSLKNILYSVFFFSMNFFFFNCYTFCLIITLLFNSKELARLWLFGMFKYSSYRKWPFLWLKALLISKKKLEK